MIPVLAKSTGVPESWCEMCGSMTRHVPLGICPECACPSCLGSRRFDDRGFRDTGQPAFDYVTCRVCNGKGVRCD